MKNKEIEQQHIKSQQRLNEMLLKNGMMKDEYKIVAIGYLSIDEEFEKGAVSTNFLNKLKILWNEGGCSMTLGFHTCEFCNKATSSSEKTLIDRENKVKYILPFMIFHYISDHKYLPPKKFIEFVMRQ